MRFYAKQHQLYCGIDLHARTMDLCLLNQAGEILVHHHMPATPEPCLNTMVPSREDVVVCVECLCTWDLAG
jgi:predicted NBD/HSP70 family sugar kinase